VPAEACEDDLLIAGIWPVMPEMWHVSACAPAFLLASSLDPARACACMHHAHIISFGPAWPLLQLTPLLFFCSLGELAAVPCWVMLRT